MIEKIKNKNANVAVIGLGYVGLPIFLSLLNSELNFKVFGIDLDLRKIDSLKKYKSYIQDISDKDIEDKLKDPEKWVLSSEYTVIKECDIILICVPTPLKIVKIPELQNKEPDWACLDSAIDGIINNYGTNKKLIIIKSTVSPTTTDDRIYNMLVHNARKHIDFYLAFSPERENPADKEYKLKNTPMVVGGINKESGEIAKLFLECLADEVLLLSHSRYAEMVKILENTFRFINISFMMEFKEICDSIGIDVWEVIKGASTKPFGFMPFYPSAGIGGHCIPVDPYYLQDVCQNNNIHSQFIEVADSISSKQPRVLTNKIHSFLTLNGNKEKDIKILLLGMAYKPNVSDVRNSPSLQIIKYLTQLGYNVNYIDLYVPEIKYSVVYDKGKNEFKSVDYVKQSLNYNSDTLQSQNLVVMLTDHDYFDPQFILENSNRIFDTRAFFDIQEEKVFRV